MIERIEIFASGQRVRRLFRDCRNTAKRCSTSHRKAIATLANPIESDRHAFGAIANPNARARARSQ